MDKNVIISVKGIQSIYENEPDTIELITEGRYYRKGDEYFVKYDESEVTGMKGTTTVLKVSGDQVTLMRYGTVNSEFIFQKGQTHFSYYDTAAGAFTIGIQTSDIKVNVDDNGGEIMVGYRLNIDNNNSPYNNLYMHIREAGKTDEKYNRDN
ncbi:MAG: DUF1934 domain-containing protein [Eubacteriales bacterium]|nr:DUF1934 domain-containing protein [Eubacteriales bacterium]